MGICLINLEIGDEVMCVDDKFPYITKNKLYEVTEIYSIGNKTYIQIIDDYDYLNSYDPDVFQSIIENRNKIISNILNI